MPSLKAIRTRIVSVKNTRKITRAIKLVAASKLRRAQDAIVAARPYTAALAKVVAELSKVAGPEAHPLFADRPITKVALVVMTGDRGLAGAFSTNVIKAAERFKAEKLPAGAELTLHLIGKKGNQYFTRRNRDIASYEVAPTGLTSLTTAREAATRVIDDFLNERVDRVYLVYNEFKSAISQPVVVKQLLPVIPEALPADTKAEKAADKFGKSHDAEQAVELDYIYEPSKEALLTRLVPQYVQIMLYRAALESIAGFFAAQMTAMESATKNAGEMVSKLTLQYNRARQASITKELLEIIGGAEALKG